MFEKLVGKIEFDEKILKQYEEEFSADSANFNLKMKFVKNVAKYGVQATFLFALNFIMLSVIGALWIDSWVPLVSIAALVILVPYALILTFTAEMTVRYNREFHQPKQKNGL